MPVEFNREIYDNCGTYAGVQRHTRNKTRICGPCTKARSEYVKEWRHKSGKSKGTWVYVPDGNVELLNTINELLEKEAA